MPDLDEDASAAFMDAIGDLAPGLDLLLGIDAGGVLIALALLRDLARFGDQESCAGALAVIVDRERARHHAGRDRAVARQRRHHEAIGKRDRAELEGLKKFGWRAHAVFSGDVTDGLELCIATVSAMA